MALRVPAPRAYTAAEHRNLWRGLSLTVALFLLVSASAHADSPLRSPWDPVKVTLTETPYSCPAVFSIAPDVTLDGSTAWTIQHTLSSIRFARLPTIRRSKASGGAGLAIVAAADAFRQTGSRAAGACARQLITSLAAQNSLDGTLSSNQAFYVQGWIAGAVAIADLKVRGYGFSSPADDISTADWLKRIGEAEQVVLRPHEVRGPQQEQPLLLGRNRDRRHRHCGQRSGRLRLGYEGLQRWRRQNTARRHSPARDEARRPRPALSPLRTGSPRAPRRVWQDERNRCIRAMKVPCGALGMSPCRGSPTRPSSSVDLVSSRRSRSIPAGIRSAGRHPTCADSPVPPFKHSSRTQIPSASTTSAACLHRNRQHHGPSHLFARTFCATP